jgi:tRNA-dihydrouridine synthase
MTHQLQIQNQNPAQASSKARFEGQKTGTGITRTEYRKARRLIRDNGRYALRWMTEKTAAVMDVLLWGQQIDQLAERADIVAYCKREGIECNPRQTA